MDKRIYRNTRYQNIKQHIKNKNYVVLINKPIKTSISRIDGEKIWRIEDALKIRDDSKIKNQRIARINYHDNFDELWTEYINYCKYDLKLAYNTIRKKEVLYNIYLKKKINSKITKLTKQELLILIDKLKTSNKQKNEIRTILKAFFNWCKNEKEILIINPLDNTKDYKTENEEMKYWLPNDLAKFLNYLDDIIINKDPKEKEIAYRIKMLTIITFSLGDRIGETRALTFGSIDSEKELIHINHSINYDIKSDDFLSHTKTYSSNRTIDITSNLINKINDYKTYLINELGYKVDDNSLIFLNHKTKRPYSDITLREEFYKYIELANVPKIRMYDLRHTYVATMMLEEKEMYLFSKRIGHSSIATTVNKYGHLSNRIKKETAKVTDKYI